MMTDSIKFNRRQSKARDIPRGDEEIHGCRAKNPDCSQCLSR